MFQSCPATGRMSHYFDKTTHQCRCGRWERGYAPKKVVCAKPRAECQICEREQAVNADGTLTNHGYKRPGWGFIVGNCMGQGHQPYTAIDALEKYLTILIGYRNATQSQHDALATVEELPTAYTTGNRNRKAEQKKVGVMVKRGEDRRWIAILVSGDMAFPGVNISSFDDLLQRESFRLQAELRNAISEITRVIKRIETK